MRSRYDKVIEVNTNNKMMIINKEIEKLLLN